MYRKLKILWYLLIPLAWIGCYFLWTTSEKYILSTFTASGFWWILTDVLGAFVLIVFSIILASTLAD